MQGRIIITDKRLRDPTAFVTRIIRGSLTDEETFRVNCCCDNNGACLSLSSKGLFIKLYDVGSSEASSSRQLPHSVCSSSSTRLDHSIVMQR